ncbi:MAG: hypothetical protein QUU85_14690, partial [Candidatus Eisenbacteria bacterium]|nr:hypothetical protein [Candidatus Eisenbacteria bacterium]
QRCLVGSEMCIRDRPSRLGTIAASFPADGLELSEIVLPPSTPEELRAAIGYEARREFGPDVASSSILDGRILGPAPPEEEGGPERRRVLLGACRPEARNSVLQASSLAGIHPVVLEPGPLAGLRALFATLPSTGFSAGVIEQTASGSFLAIGAEGGGRLVRSLGTAPDREGGTDDLVRAVRETLVFFRSRSREPLSCLGLIALDPASASGFDPDLAQKLQAALGVPVRPVDPFAGVQDLPAPVRALAADAPRFAVACGLARWWEDGAALNFYPEREERQRALKRRLGRAAIATTLVTVEAALVGLLFLNGLMLKGRADALQAENTRIDQTNRALPAKQADPRLERLLALRSARMEWSPKLAALSEAIPRTLRLTEVEGQVGAGGGGSAAGDRKLDFSGILLDPRADMASVSSFLDGLRSEPGLARDFPKIRLGTLEAGEGEVSQVFRITCEPARKDS